MMKQAFFLIIIGASGLYGADAQKHAHHRRHHAHQGDKKAASQVSASRAWQLKEIELEHLTGHNKVVGYQEWFDEQIKILSKDKRNQEARDRAHHALHRLEQMRLPEDELERLRWDLVGVIGSK
ncbi:MAG TPA: hypothetical protein VLG71_03355 [Candidatus Limnocylindria bacterium]|nr:hypothetical protein [Candidatus Limnocylindria bacterium]